MFSQLDVELNKDANLGYWSELGINDCVDILRAFKARDWIELEGATASRSTDWLVRCAEALGDIPTKDSLDWLMKTAVGHGNEVAEAALESINSIIFNDPLIHAHKPTLIAWIEGLRPTATRPYLLALAALEANLKQRG
ncbi:hypothetical protein [Lysobacter sp. Root690]|uniref:hypothetical protein n=1 Tax=Lysobacter sp. Root690 TaxID=1736588 RepID=UPI0006F4F250|nr:hypothetical protein [Lysobacter sp. Root690]KRB07939.1 hypothetical protein ASD86_09020 [Lysobacter sp. Root690]